MYVMWAPKASKRLLRASGHLTRLDYCNALLAGCNKHLVNKLQRVLNCAVRLIFGGNRCDNVTPLLPLLSDKLHWLRARERITVKLCQLVYEALNGLAPSHLQDSCVCPSQLFLLVQLFTPHRVTTSSQVQVQDDILEIENSVSLVLLHVTVYHQVSDLRLHCPRSRIDLIHICGAHEDK